MRLSLIVLLLVLACPAFAQDADVATEVRPYVFKTNLSSHVPYLYSAVRFSLEIPNGNNWSTEPMIGISYHDWSGHSKMKFSPHGRISWYKYMDNTTGKNKMRLGFVYGMRAIVATKTHNPCIEHVSSSSWFAEYDCVEQVENEYTWEELNMEIGFVIGRRFVVKNMQIDADVNLGFKSIGVRRLGYVDSLTHGFDIGLDSHHDVPDPYSFLAGFDLKIGRIWGERTVEKSPPLH